MNRRFSLLPGLSLLVLIALPALAAAHQGHPHAGHEKGKAGVSAKVPLAVETTVGRNAQPAGAGLYSIELKDGTTLTTHGPDPATPDMRGTHAAAKRGAPEDDPVCATDYYQHILYARLSGQPNNYAIHKPAIQGYVKQMNAGLNVESQHSGAPGPSADYKVLCDGSSNIQVDQFTASGSSFTAVVNSADNAGFDAANADYTIFLEADNLLACGVGSYADDESLSANNASNAGGDYAVIYEDCWDGNTPMHENGHNQGAVQYGAPDSTGSGSHCNDEYDVMCYAPDGGNKRQLEVVTCTDGTLFVDGDYGDHFDCGHDTYFDAANPTGYLASHWNIGSPLNRFIEFGGGGGGTGPSASFTFECTGLECDFTDESSDDVGVTGWSWDFGDSGTSTSQSPIHTYPASGTYYVSLTASDTTATTDMVTLPVTVSDGSSHQLLNGFRETVNAGSRGSYDRFSFQVPRKRSRLSIRIDGEPCEYVGKICEPDLDLYVARGYEPDANNFGCAPFEPGITEACVYRPPRKGLYKIAVHNFGAPAGQEYTILAKHRR